MTFPPARPARLGLSIVLLAVVACADANGPREDQAPDDAWRTSVSVAIQSALASPPGPTDPSWASDLQAFYDGVGFAPQWLDGRARPSADAREALALLRAADADGLDSREYDADELAALADRIDRSEPAESADLADFDRRLSTALLRYMRHLHLGRVDPRTIGFRLSVPPDTADDFVGQLRAALTGHRMAALPGELAPLLVLYRNLRAALQRYRELAAGESDALPVPARSVHPGDVYPALPALARRLTRLGDLPAGPAVAAGAATYGEPIVEGVRRFQRRHGLIDDGILGRQTMAAINVPLAWRVRQIELALERLRWLPHLGSDRFLAVNIPMFRLWAWDAIPPTGEPLFDMAVIVGRALDTETPIFVERMDSVIFRPYWNVPRSILLEEILPAIAEEPGYLAAHDMEIVRGQADASPVVPATADNVAALRSGVLRVRQRPGPGNALGLVKFMFPNNENVYMHDTPAPALFARGRRDFSHGCVRVEDPVGLATWALAEQPEWTRERIVQAMNGSRTFTVRLSRPVEVILYYVTAAVLPQDGTLRFADDIYGHDVRLDRALVAGSQ